MAGPGCRRTHRPPSRTRSRPRSMPPTVAGRGRADLRVGQRSMELVPIGIVESPLMELADAPKQGSEGAPDAWLVFDDQVAEGLDGIGEGDEILVLTWLDRARR